MPSNPQVDRMRSSYLKGRRLVATLALLCGSALGEPAGDAFFADVDLGVGLPADQVYPQGRIFPYMGFSGVFERDATNGFSVAGPHYGLMEAQPRLLGEATNVGCKFVYGIGLDGHFAYPPFVDYKPDTFRREVERQVRMVADSTNIVWWYVRPEEMRPWRGQEMEYLRALAETVRACDPKGRPIWMYDPGHRSAEFMAQTGQFLDILGKGAYVEYLGASDRRGIVRLHMAEQVAACRACEVRDGRPRMPLAVLQLSEDHHPVDDIPRWVEHDVFASLIAGAKGVAIWSLFKRPSVKATYGDWYESYARCGRLLTGPEGLGTVFLFGVTNTLLSVEQLSGPTQVMVRPKSRITEEISIPALGTLEATHRGHHYLFLCNSSTANVEVGVSGWPSVAMMTNMLGAMPPVSDGRMRVQMAPWGVSCVRFDRPESK